MRSHIYYIHTNTQIIVHEMLALTLGVGELWVGGVFLWVGSALDVFIQI